MHISDGIFSDSLNGQIILVAGSALAAAGVAVGIVRLDYERMPKVAVLSSGFFVASLIQVPLFGASVHPVLNGLTGVILGWAAFPAFAIALFLQYLFFGFGGITTLGVNTLNFGLSAIACYYLFNHPIRRWKAKPAVFGAGFLAGALGVALAAALAAGELTATGESLKNAARALFLAHMPIAVAEGLLTGFIAIFLKDVKPEALESPVRAFHREKPHV